MKHYIKTAVLRVTTLFALVIMLASQAQARNWFVKTAADGGNDANDGNSWGAAVTLDYALKAARVPGGGDKVFVKYGTYMPASATTNFMIFTNTAMYGSFAGTEANETERTDTMANRTIISGDLDSDGVNDTTTDAARLLGMLGGDEVVDGFTFQGASPYATGNPTAVMTGTSAIKLLTAVAGRPRTIRNCMFTKNVAAFGGAVCTYVAWTGDLIFENCIFTKNGDPVAGTGSAVYYGRYNTGSIYLKNCVMATNYVSATDGGFQWRSGTLKLYNTIFFEPRAGGTLVANSFGQGLKKNGGTWGGAINCLVTNTFDGNWNTPAPINNVSFTGDGTQTGFSNPDNNDFSLATGSPAIDKGSNTLAVAKDIIGNTRPTAADFSTKSDIGAYEKQSGGTLYSNYIYTKPQGGLTGTVNTVSSSTDPIVTANLDPNASVAMSSLPQTNSAGTTRWIPTNWVSSAVGSFEGMNKTFSITANTYWTNNFRVEYKCTAAMSGAGAGCSATVASTWVTNGDSITFTAVEGSGYAFVRWNEDSSTANPHSVTISAATTMTAVFQLTAIPFNVESVPSGRSFRLDTVDQSTPFNGAASSGDHAIDTAATQTVDSVTQARFKNWTDGLSQLLTPVTTTGLTYSVTQEETLQANFDLYYKLTTNSPTGGTIAIGSPSDDNYYLNGASKTLTANADSGYAFKNWSGDIGSANAADSEITVTMNQGRSIQANFAKVLYVTTTASATGAGATWADAARLTNAINSLVAGDEIWAAAGTYYPPDNTHGIQLKNSVVIYGGMTVNQGWAGRNWAANPTIISGDFSGDGYSDMTNSALMDMSNQTAVANATLDGLIFQYGSNNASTATMYGGALGHRASVQNGSYTIRHCVFRYNYGTHGGAMYHNYGDAVIENSLFYNNTSANEGGAIFIRRGTLTMRGCTLANNIGATAGDFALDGATGNATDCIFGSYTGSGTPAASVYAKSGSAMTLTKCYAVTNGAAAITLVNCSTADPKLRSPAGLDFRLKSDSPCIGTASGTTLTDDLTGAARPYPAGSGVRDVGCYEASGFYNNTVNSSPVGRDVVVDGTASVAGPANVVTCEGPVVMSAASTQTVSTTRYIFQQWTDGFNAPVSNPTNSFTMTQATNWTAEFATQYKMTVTYNPAQGLVKLASGDALTLENIWTASGSDISLTASVLPGFAFGGWSGDTTGDTNSLTMTVTMSAAKALTANFTASAVAVTVKKDDATTGEVRFLVDGDEWTNTWDFSFEPDTVHTVEVVDAVQDWNDDKVGYVWSSWSDALGRKHEFTATTPVTLTATMQKQYQWTLTKVGSGTATPATGWYNDGATFTAEATSAGFSGWSGDVSSENATVSVTMSARKDVTATFNNSIVYVDDVAGTDTPGNGTAWATAYKTLPYALDNSAAGSEFWVAAGTYKTLGGTSYMGLQDGDAIYGGFAGGETARGSRNWAANRTTITGDTNGDGVSEMTTQALMRFLGAITDTWTATLDGLTFEYGNNTGVGSSSTPYGGAIGADGNASGMYTIRHCIFRYNKAATGDALGLSRGNSIVENCLFYGNGSGASTKAAIYNRRATVRLVNCTMADNVAGDINTDTTYPIKATNCIFRGSITFDGAGSSFKNCSYASTPANFTDEGGNNTDAPGFAGTGSYQLGAGSLMQDTGTAVGLGDSLDLAGKARVSGTIDRGAYEGSYYKVTVTPTAGAVVTFNGQTIAAATDVVVEPNTTYQATRTAVQTVGTTKYTFSKWTLDSIDGAGSPFDVAVGTANRVLDAVFTVSYQLALTITPVGYGTVGGATHGNFYNAGTILTLDPAAVAGAAFLSWSGDLTGSSDPQNLTMSAAKSVTATFVADGPTAILFQ